MDEEHPLTGGNATASVVRVGDTVRKPWTPASASVVSFMRHLRACGVDVPVVLDRDSLGRLVTEFVPGELAMERGPLSSADLRRAGALVRLIHDASETFVPNPDAVWITAIPAPGADPVCHNDLAPWNLIVGDRWTFIDWDSSAPSTRLWDLAYSAQAFALNDPRQSPDDAARALGAFICGYGADARLREALPVTMAERAEAMYRLLRTSHETGREPWATMYLSGHGEHWRAATRFVHDHEAIWREALRRSIT